jgi:hypothetical protein
MKNKYIWIVVGFSTNYIAGLEYHQESEQYARDKMKRNGYSRCSDFMTPDEQIERLKHSIPKPANRGYFLSKKEAEAYIKKYPDAIHEYYYSFLCLEKHYLGVADSHAFGEDDEETWFELVGDDYKKVDRPDFALGVCSFA